MGRLKALRSQPRLRGISRDPLGSAVLHEIREAVTREAFKHGVSRSFVVATILADHFGITEQADYRRPPAKPGQPLAPSAYAKGKERIQ